MFLCLDLYFELFLYMVSGTAHNKLRKILKEMGLSDHLTCLLRNLYAGQEVTVRTRHGTTDWFQIGKGENPVCMISVPLDYEIFASCFMSLDMFQCPQV